MLDTRQRTSRCPNIPAGLLRSPKPALNLFSIPFANLRLYEVIQHLWVGFTAVRYNFEIVSVPVLDISKRIRPKPKRSHFISNSIK